MSNDAMADLVERATEAARGILRRNFSKTGIAASVDGYPQVWARDAVITSLGAAVDRDPEALAAFRTSLQTLASRQDRFGQIPFLVTIDGGHAQFGAADSNPWFVIGSAYYSWLSGDADWAAGQADAVVRALDWCESMDVRKMALMSSGECSDWADLVANRGHVLFPNVLYARALQAAGRMLAASRPEEAARFRARHDEVVEAIRTKLWVRSYDEVKDGTHEKAQASMSLTLRRRHYFLPWFHGFDYGERFDTTANLMAVATGVATADQARQILDYIDQVGLDRPYPVRVLHPPIMPGEADWRDYYKVWDLNMPNQYHNGGIWPWVGGLYVAVLAAVGRLERARLELARLAEAVRQGIEVEWEFNEHLHGVSGKPMGAKYQAWSAGMFLYARHVVETGAAPGLAEAE